MDHQDEVLFQTFLEKTHNGLVFKVRNSSFFVFSVGDDFLNLTGLKRSSILHKDLTELPPGIFHSSTKYVFAGVLLHKKSAIINPFFIQIENDERSFYTSVKITPILHTDGQVTYLLYTLLVIDNKISEAKEMINRNYFMQLLDQAPVGICILRDKKLTVESANNMMLELLGKSDAILNLPLAIALPELHGQSLLKLIDDVFTWGEPLVGNEAKVYLIRNSKYETAYFNFVYQPIKDNLGVTTGIMMIAAEVTSLVLVKQQLEESVSNFKSVVMNAHYGLLVLKGEDWIVEVVNQPMLNLWDKKKEQVQGLPLMEILPELVGQPFPAHLRQVTDSAISHVIKEEVFYYNTDGGIKKKYVSFFYDPMMDKEGKVFGIIVGAEDITERVESRLKSERAEEMLRIAIESANLGTWHYDPINESLIVSPRLKALFGYTENEEITYHSVMGKVTEEYRFILLKAIKSSVSYGEQFNLDFSIVGNTKNKLRWMRATGRIYRDNEGIPMRFSGILMEITEHKQNEIRKNDFIAMVSHELKTPLTSLKAYVQLLALKAKQSGDVYTIKSLNKVDGQVNKMNNMIRSFLDLSRLEAGKLNLDKERFSIEKLIAEIVEETSLIDKTHVISTNACKPITIYADREKIGQVINNLLSNAIKYSNQGTHIHIGMDLKGNNLQVWVKDEGLGISKEDTEMLFSRFYRVENTPLKTVSGFGIGLYLSAEIIQRHKGSIWVESEVGKGSVFYFSLPIEGSESKEAQ